MNSGTKVVTIIENFTETEHIFVFIWFPINELIYTFLKGENVRICSSLVSIFKFGIYVIIAVMIIAIEVIVYGVIKIDFP